MTNKREKLQPWDTPPPTEELWTHDPRGFTFDDFHRLRRQPNERGEVNTLSQAHRIAAKYAIEHGGFVRDEDGTFVHRLSVAELADSLKSGHRILGASEVVRSVYFALLASSQPGDPEA